VILIPKSKVGRGCVRLFLDWYDGKITKEEFDFKLNLIKQKVEDKQMPLEFEEKLIKGVN